MMAQQTIYDEATVLYRKEVKGGIKFHGHGWGFHFTKGYQKAVNEILQINVSLASMKHPKETKSYNPWYENAKPYIYGKQNSFYVLRPSIGKHKILTYKHRKSGVQFGYNWAIGPSLGLTKPIYLEIGKPTIPYDYIVVEEYDASEHFIEDIFGRASWSRGISELQLHPGVYGKFGFLVEYSGEQTGIRGLETGISLDAYPKDIPIMTDEFDQISEVDNKRFFLNFYLNLFLGKKYN
ncbi:MAG: hypothetical protein HKN39_05705 [Flavobacteriales bacterium]|nr:hypothetical protein [Flavobacteriales bacterium]